MEKHTSFATADFKDEPQSAAGNAFIRAFIAVSIGAETLARIEKVQMELQKPDVKAKWVSPETMHLTLLFLGDIPAPLAATAADALDSVAADFAPFSFAVAGLRLIGGRRSPRMIWAEVWQEAEILLIQARLAAKFDALGFSLEKRPFKPHLTLARIKQVDDPGGLEKIIAQHLKTEFGKVRVDRLLLIKSTLLPDGPLHDIIHAARLGGRGENT